ncbi:hypothetical protein [Nocardioides limicola]|uniref:hypothetical protein n=1 Tax=Nocardioides limicola TaxID=2803368 RepID=UPI00193B51FB|nr:hypothetical protein [Nocardioides sp. DJM-14]
MRLFKRRSFDADGPIRFEDSVFVRLSVTAFFIAVGAGVVALFLLRRWTNPEITLVIGVVAAVALLAYFLSPESLVVDTDEVRDESGWRRTGWRIIRSEVAEVRWDGDPQLFEPLHLTFVAPDGEILLSTPVEFDVEVVSRALAARGWPLKR